MPRRDDADGFTLPIADVEAAIGRGVARALGLRVAPEDCPACEKARREARGGSWEACRVHGERP